MCLHVVNRAVFTPLFGNTDIYINTYISDVLFKGLLLMIVVIPVSHLD